MTGSNAVPAQSRARRPDGGRPGEVLQRATSNHAVIAVVLAVSAFLLVTMGGAIVAAPLTLPILYAIARHRTGLGHWVTTVIAALTMAEAVWAATYVTIGEAKPWIWLVPLVAAAAILAGFHTARGRAASAHSQ